MTFADEELEPSFANDVSPGKTKVAEVGACSGFFGSVDSPTRSFFTANMADSSTDFTLSWRLSVGDFFGGDTSADVAGAPLGALKYSTSTYANV